MRKLACLLYTGMLALALVLVSLPARAGAQSAINTSVDPAFSSATVNGSTLTLRYNQALSSSSVPSTSDFAVKFDGSAISVSKVTITGSAVVLSLAQAATPTNVVTLDYTPGTRPIMNSGGTATGGLVGQSVTNTSARPALKSAAINGITLILTYDQPLSTSSVPAMTDFNVLYGAGAVAVSKVAISGTTVTLTMASGAGSGTVVTLDYTPGLKKVQNADGTTAVALVGQSVANGSSTPSLTTAAIEGNTLILAYDEDLSTSSIPAATDLTVRYGAIAQTITKVSISGNLIILTLAQAAIPSDTVTVSYTPGTKPVQNPAGTTAGTLVGQAVTNTSSIPVLTSAAINGQSVTLSYNQDLNGSSTPAATDFVVKFGSSAISVGKLSLSGSVVTLSLAQGALPSDTVTVSYTPGSKPLQNPAGNRAAAFVNQVATNSSTTPALSTALVTGNTLTLTYNQDLNTGSAPATNNYAVRIGGFSVSVSKVTLSGSIITLTLSAGAKATDAVYADYTPGTKPVQNQAGTKAPGFTNQSATNGSSVSPVLSTAMVNGTTLTLSYNQALNTGSTPAPGDYAVRFGITPVTISKVTLADSTVTLTLAQGARAIDAVYVDYTLGTKQIQNTGGTPAASFSNQFATNNSADPAVAATSVNGTTLVLTYSQALSASSVPAASDFSVKFGLTPISVSKVTVSASAVTLTLSKGAKATDSVYLDYTRGTKPIQNTAGTPAPSFTGQVVTNDSSVPPGVSTAAIDGKTLTLTFNQSLSSASVPAAADFAVRFGASVISISKLTVSGSTVTLTLGLGARSTDSVYADYTPGSKPLQNTAGTEAAAFSSQSVTNNSTNPTLSSASINGNTLTFTFSQALNATSVSGVNDFVVRFNSTVIPVSKVALSGSTVTLTLTQGAQAADTVDADYTTGANPIQNTAGTKATGFLGQSVTNGSTGPTLSSAAINGDTLTLTYNQTLSSSSVPNATEYAVKYNGVAAGAIKVTVSSATVTLSLGQAAAPADTVTLDYTPGAKPIMNTTGTAAASMTGQAVANGSATPSLSSASINGMTGTLTYSQALNTSSVPSASDYVVKFNGTIIVVSKVAITGSTVTLTTVRGASPSETVVLSYIPAAKPIQNMANNKAAGLTNQAVTNSSTAPSLSSAAINGTSLTLTYNQGLSSSSVPAATDFGVQFNGLPVEVSKVTTSGTTVTLSLGVGADSSKTVTVGYTPGSKPLQNTNLTLAAGFSNQAVTNSSAIVPTLSSAVIDGRTVSLTYSQVLSTSVAPAPLDYTVTFGGSPVGVTKVAVAGSSVSLTLATAAGPSTTVAVNYSPGAKPLQNNTGTRTAALTNQSVTNRSTTPTLISGAITGVTLTLTYSQALSSGAVPITTDFTVRYGGVVIAVNKVAVSGTTVTLTLSQGAKPSDGVTVSYTPGGKPLQNGAGTPAAALVLTGVANISTQPALTGATVNGSTLTLTFSEALNSGSTPAPTDLSVKFGSTIVLVTKVTVSGSTVVLTLDRGAKATDAVTVTYTPGAKPIQNMAGTAANGF